VKGGVDAITATTWRHVVKVSRIISRRISSVTTDNGKQSSLLFITNRVFIVLLFACQTTNDTYGVSNLKPVLDGYTEPETDVGDRLVCYPRLIRTLHVFCPEMNDVDIINSVPLWYQMI